LDLDWNDKTWLTMQSTKLDCNPDWAIQQSNPHLCNKVSISPMFYAKLLPLQIPRAQKDIHDLTVIFALFGSARIKRYWNLPQESSINDIPHGQGGKRFCGDSTKILKLKPTLGVIKNCTNSLMNDPGVHKMLVIAEIS